MKQRAPKALNGLSIANATIGVSLDRRLALVGLRYGLVIANAGPVALAYSADLIPVAIVLRPERYLVPESRWFNREIRDGAVYGFGVAPIGFNSRSGGAIGGSRSSRRLAACSEPALQSR